MHKQSYITRVTPIFLYVLSMSVYQDMYGTNFKLKDESVRGSHELGSLKVLHNDKKGYTVFADGIKHKIQPHQCSPELRSLNNKQLSAFTKAAYISVHKQSDGELSLKSHVRGNGGMMGDKRQMKMMSRHNIPVFKTGPIATAVGEVAGEIGAWTTRFIFYGSIAYVATKAVTSEEPISISTENGGKGIIGESPAAVLNRAIDKGGYAGAAAAVAKVTVIAGTAAPVAGLAGQAAEVTGAMLATVAEQSAAGVNYLKSNAAEISVGSAITGALGRDVQMAESGLRNFAVTSVPNSVDATTQLVGPGFGSTFAKGTVGAMLTESSSGFLGKDNREALTNFKESAERKVGHYANNIGVTLLGTGAIMGTSLTTTTATTGAGMTAAQVLATSQAANVPAVVTVAKEVIVPAATGLHWGIECAAGAVRWGVRGICHLLIPF